MTTITRRRRRLQQSTFTQVTRSLLKLVGDFEYWHDTIEDPNTVLLRQADSVFEEFDLSREEYRAQARARGIADAWFYRHNIWELI